MLTPYINSFIGVDKASRKRYEAYLEKERHPSEAVLWSGTADLPHILFRVVFGVFIFMPLVSILFILIFALLPDRGVSVLEILSMLGISIGALVGYLVLSPFLIACAPIYITDRRVIQYSQGENGGDIYTLDITAATKMRYGYGSQYIEIYNPGPIFDLERLEGEARKFYLGPFQDAEPIAKILEKLIARKKETEMQQAIDGQLS